MIIPFVICEDRYHFGQGISTISLDLHPIEVVWEDKRFGLKEKVFNQTRAP